MRGRNKDVQQILHIILTSIWPFVRRSPNEAHREGGCRRAFQFLIFDMVRVRIFFLTLESKILY